MAHEFVCRKVFGGRLDRYTPEEPAWARVILFLGTGGCGSPGGPYQNLVTSLVELKYEVWAITLPGDDEALGWLAKPWALEDYVTLATYVIDQKSAIPTFAVGWSQGTLGALCVLAKKGQNTIKAATLHNVALPGALELAAFSRIAGVLPKPYWWLAIERWIIGKLARFAPELMISKTLYLPRWVKLFGQSWRAMVHDGVFQRRIAVSSLDSMLNIKGIKAADIKAPIRVLVPIGERIGQRQQEILERQGLDGMSELYSVDGGHDMPFHHEGARRVAIAAHLFFLQQSHAPANQDV